MTQSIQEMDSILGDSNERYFSSGFSKFNYQIDKFSFTEKELTGSLRVQYNGPSRPRGEQAHLGSMEYTAMALFLAEGILLDKFRLTQNELAMSILHYLSFQINAPLEFGADTNVHFSCRIINTENSLKAVNIGLTTMEIKIAHCDIHVVIDHPGPTLISKKNPSIWPLGNHSLHKEIYKERELSIGRLNIDPDLQTINAKVEQPKDYKANPWGISSSKNLLTCLDCLSVTGQLMQVLLYDLLKTQRSLCPNIWLRSMQIEFSRPYQSSSYTAVVNFSSIRSITRKGITWQLIDLSSEFGNMKGTFKICHQMPDI